MSKVIAGPGVYICDLCVGKAIGVASGVTPEIDDRTAMTTVPPGASVGLKCGFCGKARTKVSAIVVGDGARICNQCLDLCEEVLAEKADPDSR